MPKSEFDDIGWQPSKIAKDPLALAVARGHKWLSLIDDGTSDSSSALAIGVDTSYVARFIKLTLLNPVIVSMIINGKQPFVRLCWKAEIIQGCHWQSSCLPVKRKQ